MRCSKAWCVDLGPAGEGARARAARPIAARPVRTPLRRLLRSAGGFGVGGSSRGGAGPAQDLAGPVATPAGAVPGAFRRAGLGRPLRSRGITGRCTQASLLQEIRTTSAGRELGGSLARPGGRQPLRYPGGVTQVIDDE